MSFSVNIPHFTIHWTFHVLILVNTLVTEDLPWTEDMFVDCHWLFSWYVCLRGQFLNSMTKERHYTYHLPSKLLISKCRLLIPEIIQVINKDLEIISKYYCINLVKFSMWYSLFNHAASTTIWQFIDVRRDSFQRDFILRQLRIALH